MSLANEVLAHVSTYTDDGEEFSNVQSEYLNELVNSHDALVAVLQEISDFVDERPWTGLADTSGYEGYEDLVPRIKEALTAAKA